ncbi:hypothetical protein TELCIR_03875 [Teladorsagia circumcincta]|uniref:glucuronosyltransferase n=1 Tax=Teladorsagia circumcincta TaxID=45464 RepID=A0A2G9UV83_TELCI|nr:hypothetical protein TELCIR_03875 [Teladorsagia circumcincta]
MKRVWSLHGAAADVEYYKKRTNYLLSNTDEFLEFGRPSSLKIVHIGGIALKDSAPLSERLQQIVKHANMGVVYISFGSVAPTREMPKYFREAVIEVAKVFSNYDFIWKVDEGDAVQNISNLHTFSWVAQAALLGRNGGEENSRKLKKYPTERVELMNSQKQDNLKKTVLQPVWQKQQLPVFKTLARKMLANERFDAGITEMLGTCGFGIFNKIGLDHMIAASAVGVADSMADYYDVPKLPSIVPCGHRYVI